MLILFDCDGVLVDSEPTANRVMAGHLTAHDYRITAAETRRRFIGMTVPGIMTAVRDAGVDLPDDFECTLKAKDEITFARELKPVAGVADTLERLRDRPKAVVSSGRPDKIRRNLEITGLAGHFGERLFSATMVTHPKPGPDLPLYAARQLGHGAADCVVVEDTALGIEAPRRAGMRALGFFGASDCTPAPTTCSTTWHGCPSCWSGWPDICRPSRVRGPKVAPKNAVGRRTTL